eukprot:Protomagalhaensia_sp_Gyna_25__3944@NODE_354_length_3757_cov_19_342657_g273_i0_p1_GENE_NODE_354_length_3757_cov_19_342657_g273_i0NODE_354_length_3757_cov_19_342657_g273_i0_p1_ORF_typecomplete_len704_score170_01ANAPC3/PF12895_7/0_0012BTAD/PF03704_17/1_3e03BTAD/PF03704_17/0_0063TPR_MalT/PF17874_1/0_0048TPR_1/PF00515_28/58TPR_1/PF00515_28/7_1TPR_1/PF00515_28/6_9TPR_16/PF13432_6/2_1TPR_16/PF13432_6/0_33TPR_19/PF14559_6/2_9e03TPR_19/PF14559_6/6_1TPR_19/PF14559_6/0_063DUF3600/PF12207_8/0_51TPR_2/PF0771
MGKPQNCVGMGMHACNTEPLPKVETSEAAWTFVKSVTGFGFTQQNDGARVTLSNSEEAPAHPAEKSDALDYSRFENLVSEIEKEENQKGARASPEQRLLDSLQESKDDPEAALQILTGEKEGAVEKDDGHDKDDMSAFFLNKDSMAAVAGCAHDRSKERALYDRPTVEKLRMARRFRLEGNVAFGEREFQQASVNYQKALIYYDYTFPENDQQEQEFQQDKLSAHLNLAAAKLNLQEYRECIVQCYQATKMDDKCMKAYYRKAQAHLALDEFDEVDKVLAQAKELQSEMDPSFKRLQTECQAKRAQHAKAMPQVLKKMFEAIASPPMAESPGAEEQKSGVEAIEDSEPEEAESTHRETEVPKESNQMAKHDSASEEAAEVVVGTETEPDPKEKEFSGEEKMLNADIEEPKEDNNEENRKEETEVYESIEKRHGETTQSQETVPPAESHLMSESDEVPGKECVDPVDEAKISKYEKDSVGFIADVANVQDGTMSSSSQVAPQVVSLRQVDESADESDDDGGEQSGSVGDASCDHGTEKAATSEDAPIRRSPLRSLKSSPAVSHQLRRPTHHSKESGSKRHIPQRFTLEDDSSKTPSREAQHQFFSISSSTVPTRSNCSVGGWWDLPTDDMPPSASAFKSAPTRSLVGVAFFVGAVATASVSSFLIRWAYSQDPPKLRQLSLYLTPATVVLSGALAFSFIRFYGH